MRGGDGRDIFRGGAGADTMRGEEGADTFCVLDALEVRHFRPPGRRHHSHRELPPVAPEYDFVT